VTIFFLKSILSLLMLLPAVYGMYAMYAVFGQTPDADRATKHKRRHRAAGYVFVVLFLGVFYLCVAFAIAARTEPSPRAAIHILLALAIAALFMVKVLFLRRFRQFYEQTKIIGTTIGILSFMLVGISAGYYLAVSHFGLDRTMDRSATYALRGPFLAVKQIGGFERGAIRTDHRSIERGRVLFVSRCSACHDPQSTRVVVGPGLQGLLRKPKLPVSGHPATAESIRFQLKQPLGRMPSFAYLSPDEVEDLIAYLNTL
jgi:mono/diheme cytochrome c family protein/heme/copper-type cytochrome/quinol oxidase subunit 4